MMFDAHCETLLKVYKDGNLNSNAYDVDFERLAKYGKAIQMFAIFNEGDLRIEDIVNLIELLKTECSRSDLATFCAGDYIECDSPVTVLVSIEGVGNTPDFDIGYIDLLHKSGVRTMSITWNNDNQLCGGIEANNKGLTQEGINALKRMENLGMVLDVSHISDIGFYDALEFENLRIVATHSNSRTVCANNRNLTDEQFKILCTKGGVAGINTYPMFLNGTYTASVTDIIRHIEHFCSLGGENNIGIGSDFDGMNHLPQGINGVEDICKLTKEMQRCGYSDLLIKKIMAGNFLNLMKKILV